MEKTMRQTLSRLRRRYPGLSVKLGVIEGKALIITAEIGTRNTGALGSSAVLKEASETFEEAKSRAIGEAIEFSGLSGDTKVLAAEPTPIVNMQEIQPEVTEDVQTTLDALAESGYQVISMDVSNPETVGAFTPPAEPVVTESAATPNKKPRKHRQKTDSGAEIEAAIQEIQPEVTEDVQTVMDALAENGYEVISMDISNPETVGTFTPPDETEITEATETAEAKATEVESVATPSKKLKKHRRKTDSSAEADSETDAAKVVEVNIVDITDIATETKAAEVTETAETAEMTEAETTEDAEDIDEANELELAMRKTVSFGKNKGKTLGDLATAHGGVDTIKWIAFDYSGTDIALKKAAKLVYAACAKVTKATKTA